MVGLGDSEGEYRSIACRDRADFTDRGIMFTGVPNMAWMFGHFRAGWTLRADLVEDFVCRLLNRMKEKGARKVTPALRPEDKDMPRCPGSIRRTSIPAI
jgi:cation diffusion facilitator CzcD-associated flavoprotein CzcO